MIRGFFIEFVLPLLLILIVRSLLNSFLSNFRGKTVARREPPPAPPPSPATELKKDPVCGTYVSTGASVTRMVKGQLVHFCSPACRDKYVA
jgi:YHS domain-containing protein